MSFLPAFQEDFDLIDPFLKTSPHLKKEDFACLNENRDAYHLFIRNCLRCRSEGWTSLCNVTVLDRHLSNVSSDSLQNDVVSMNRVDENNFIDNPSSKFDTPDIKDYLPIGQNLLRKCPPLEPNSDLMVNSVTASSSDQDDGFRNFVEEHQRRKACDRERVRMRAMNRAFDRLRTKLPSPLVGSGKLSKIQSLR